MSKLYCTRIGIGKKSRKVLLACALAVCVGFEVTTSYAATILLDLNAQNAGSSSDTRWVPTVGDDGTNAGTLTGSPLTATRATSGTTSYYHFTHTATDSSNISLTKGSSVEGFEKASNANLYFEKTDAYTLEVLVRPGLSSWLNSTTNIGAIIGSQSGSAVGYSLTLSSTSTSNPTAYNVSFTAVRNGSNQLTLNTTGTPVTIGEWTHIVVTYDGAGVLQIYINGTLAIQTTSAQAATNLTTLANITTNVPTGDTFAIGQRDATKGETSSSNALWYGGDLALARVYSGTLTSQEVTNSYTSAIALIPEPATVAFLAIGCSLLIQRYPAR